MQFQASLGMDKIKQSWKLYILECGDGSLYTGITLDIERRLTEHQSGKGAKYTRGRAPLRLVYSEVCGTKSAALLREMAVKKMSRAGKMGLYKTFL